MTATSSLSLHLHSLVLQLRLHYHFILQDSSNLVHSATFMACTRGMPGSYLDKDTDHPEILRCCSLSLLENAATALFITLRPLCPSSCSPLPLHHSLSNAIQWNICTVRIAVTDNVLHKSQANNSQGHCTARSQTTVSD